jgi:hypothetical protein
LYLVDWIITIDIISCAQFVPKNKHIRKGRSMASWEEFFESTVLGEGWYTNVELAVVAMTTKLTSHRYCPKY